MKGRKKHKKDGESGIKCVEHFVSEFQGLGAACLFFKTTFLYLTGTAWGIASRNGIAVHHTVHGCYYPEMSSMTTCRRQDTSNRHPWRIAQACACMSVCIRPCSLSLCQPTIWARAPTVLNEGIRPHVLLWDPEHRHTSPPFLLHAFIWKTLQQEGRAGKPGAQQGPLMSLA